MSKGKFSLVGMRIILQVSLIDKEDPQGPESYHVIILQLVL